MNCLHCNNKLIHSGDNMYDECGCEGEGIISNLSCPNDDCGVSLVLVYIDIEV